MKLEGSLTTFPLRELIDMVVYSSVTGVLNIYGPGSNGHLYFRNSSVYHVEHGAATGVEALAELLELQRGEFSFVSDIVAQNETLYGGLGMHLAAAERLAARWRQVRAYVPSLDLVPQPLLAREAAQRRMSPAHYGMLGPMNGTATLREIATQLGWAEIDVAEAAAQLSLDGLIELRRGRPAEQRDEARPESGREGLFDRLIGRAAPAGRAEPGDSPRPAEVQQRSGEDLILRLLRGSG